MPGPYDVTQSDDFIAALGTADDPSIAQQFGVATGTVKYHRDAHGIASYRSVRRQAVKDCVKAGWNDSAIQAETGMDRRAVARLRAKMGVLNPYNAKASTNRQRVKTYLKASPKASDREVGKALGIAHSWVRILRATP
jgi:hypothetical protein